MKNIITFALLLTILSFSSCKKATTTPEATKTAANEDKTIKVQYRVTATSGQMNIEYTSFEGGVITTTTTQVNRLTFSYSFEWSKGEKLSINASNTNPSGKEVLVEIYVNGVLFQSGLANAPGAVASAEGVYDN